MQIISTPISALVPYNRNPRKITQKAINAVATSLREFGWKQPIVVDKNNVVIVGHTRLQAAEQLGFKEVPVLKAADLTPEQVVKYRLVDNKSGEFSLWDEDLLDLELGSVELGDIAFMFEDDDLEPYLFDDDDDEEGAGLGEPIIQYNIIFDNVEQQKVWFEFIKRTKEKYSNAETFAEALTQHLLEAE